MNITKRVEVSRDGLNWLPCFIREAPQADVRPDSRLPEGYVWEKHGGHWVQVEDVGTLSS